MPIKAIRFNDVSQEKKQTVANLIFNQWRSEFKLSNIHKEGQVVQHFEKIFACFVFIDTTENSLIGAACITIDTPAVSFNTNFWIQNVFIVEHLRNQGFGKKILCFLENFLVKQGVSIAQLWCENDIVEFYKKMNWNITEQSPPNKENARICIKMLATQPCEITYQT